MEILGYIIIASIVVSAIYFIVTMVLVQANGEPTSNFQDHRQCKGIAKKVWDDIHNNDTLTFNSFEDYWEWLAEKHKLN